MKVERSGVTDVNWWVQMVAAAVAPEPTLALEKRLVA